MLSAEKEPNGSCEKPLRSHGRGTDLLTIGHKANVIKSDVFFRDICLTEAKAAGIRCNDKFIDALSLDLLQHPEKYNVVVTTNMFGDILSDVAAYLVGGLGLVPSANIGDRYALFEPVHGSAPDIAGKNIANPIAAVRSAAMLLDHLGDPSGAATIEEAIRQVLRQGICTRDMGGSQGPVNSVMHWYNPFAGWDKPPDGYRFLSHITGLLGIPIA